MEELPDLVSATPVYSNSSLDKGCAHVLNAVNGVAIYLS